MIELLKSFLKHDFIGYGYEYMVFDCGDRVKKVPQPVLVTFAAVLMERIGSMRLKGMVGQFKTLKRDPVKPGQLDRFGIPRELFGNPRFDGEVYFQDKAVPLGEKLKDADPEQQKSVIDSYLDFLERCVFYGFYDTTWKFPVNNGMINGRNVQIDLGEISFNSEKFKSDVESGKWQEQWVNTDLFYSELREYFVERMEKFDEEFIEENWAEKRN
jgi:hypothetical protein